MNAAYATVVYYHEAHLNDDLSGLLQKCKHKFCYACIVNWSKVCTKCPLCKVDFSFILKVRRGIRIQSHRVEPKELNEENDHDDLDEQVIIEGTDNACYKCNQLGDSTKLLVCDHCNFKVCHTSCLDEPLDWIPEEDFYCLVCCEKFGLKNIFLPPQPFNAELYAQIREEADERNIPSRLRKSRRGRPLVDRNRGRRDYFEEDASENAEIMDDNFETTSIAIRSFYGVKNPEELKKAREERTLRQQKRLNAEVDDRLMLSVPHNYKGSPVKKSKDNRGHWRRRAIARPVTITDEEYQNTPGVLFSINDINYHKDPEQVKLWRKKNQERSKVKVQEDESEENYVFGEEDQQLLEEDEKLEKEEKVESLVNNYHRKSFRPLTKIRGSGETNQSWGGIKGVEERLCVFGLSSGEDNNSVEEHDEDDSMSSEEVNHQEVEDSELNNELSPSPVRSIHTINLKVGLVLSNQRKYPKRTPCHVVDFPFNKSKIEEMRPVHEKIPSLLGGGAGEPEVSKKRNISKNLNLPEGPQTVCNFFKASSKQFEKIVKINPRKRSEEKLAFDRPKQDERDLFRLYRGGFKVNPKGKNGKEQTKGKKAKKGEKIQDAKRQPSKRTQSENRLRERSRDSEKRVPNRRLRA